MPASSRHITLYCAPPSGMRLTSLDSIRWRNRSASGPRVSTSPMCETSKTPTLFLTAMCSSLMPLYWTGISNPANGIIRAPAARCRSCSGVLRMAGPILLDGWAAGRGHDAGAA
jgi:hypothetical protein